MAASGASASKGPDGAATMVLAAVRDAGGRSRSAADGAVESRPIGLVGFGSAIISPSL